MGYTPISERVATVTFVAFRPPSRSRTIDRLSITGLSPAADLAAHRASFPAALCESAFGERAVAQALKGEAAYGSRHDDKPGLRRLLTRKHLPPMATPSHGRAQVVPTCAQPQVPGGFWGAFKIRIISYVSGIAPSKKSDGCHAVGFP